MKSKKAPPVHTHARHTQPRALSHCAPARGYVRSSLACDGARVLAALGGLDSSGVACAGTSSEEGEAYHARAKTNHKHVRAGKVRVRLDTRGYITRLAETGVQAVLFRRTAGASGADGSHDSRCADHACHARCAAPDRPVGQRLRPSVRTCVGLRARLRTHFLGVTGSGPLRPAPKELVRPKPDDGVRRPELVCPRRSSAAFFACAYAAVHRCTVVKARPIQRHVLLVAL